MVGEGRATSLHFSSRQELRSSGRLLVSPSPSLPVWHRRRVVGVVVVPGKPGSGVVRVGNVGSWCGSARPINPGPPPPLAWLGCRLGRQ